MTITVPDELYAQAERAAKDAGWKGVDALVISRLRSFVEYGDVAFARGPKAAADDWEPVAL